MEHTPFMRKVKRVLEEHKQFAPLDGKQYVTSKFHQVYHHYIKVVSTHLNTGASNRQGAVFVGYEPDECGGDEGGEEVVRLLGQFVCNGIYDEVIYWNNPARNDEEAYYVPGAPVTIWNNPDCKCDLYTYLSLEDEMKLYSACHAARVGDGGYDEWNDFLYDDRILLERIYNNTGGIYWFENTGWSSELDHCEWYGITCDDEGYVTEIMMRQNNITEDLSKLYKLRTLDLAENNLSGFMAGSGSWTYDIRVSSLIISTIQFINPFPFKNTGSVPSLPLVNCGLAVNPGNVGDCEGAQETHSGGFICLVQRGDIRLDEKVMYCESVGGQGMVIYNNEIGPISGLPIRENYGGIPVIGISDTEGQSIINLDPLPSGQFEVTANREEWIDHSPFFSLRDLTYVDLSQNNLSGRIDALFAPALGHANFSDNNFTSFSSFKAFKRSHETLRTFDLSFNSIQQQASDIMKNMPPNIEQFILSGNMIQGTLPPRENLNELRQFDMGSNHLSGSLPDFYREYPNLQELNLSNQKQEDGSGLSGSISARLSNLLFLTTLDLAGNKLTGPIPAAFGNFGQLKLLNFSDNVLTKTIPAELGRLAGTLEVFDVSINNLSGQIPSEIGQFKDAKVRISGNTKISNPAPLSLCSFPTNHIDLSGNTNLCHPKRQALKSFYESAKGSEWTESTNWLDEYDTCGFWYGVTCTDGAVTGLALSNNGLSGRLGTHIGELRSLEILDLSDNDIKGSIPAEMGLLTNLTYLRLSYNSFVGNVSDEFLNLTQLQLVQLHGNRLTGKIPDLNVTPKDDSLSGSSFISDC
ncbi:hypothetical protein ACHAXR_005772, partial [Thalassiosira sp. AJA248-18]